MLAGKMTSDFLTALIEVIFPSTGACAEYKYFHLISSMNYLTGLLPDMTDVGEWKGECGREAHVRESTSFAKRSLVPFSIFLSQEQ